jgi:hypothetical protein
MYLFTKFHFEEDSRYYAYSRDRLKYEIKCIQIYKYEGFIWDITNYRAVGALRTPRVHLISKLNKKRFWKSLKLANKNSNR